VIRTLTSLPQFPPSRSLQRGYTALPHDRVSAVPLKGWFSSFRSPRFFFSSPSAPRVPPFFSLLSGWIVSSPKLRTLDLHTSTLLSRFWPCLFFWSFFQALCPSSFLTVLETTFSDPVILMLGHSSGLVFTFPRAFSPGVRASSGITIGSAVWTRTTGRRYFSFFVSVPLPHLSFSYHYVPSLPVNKMLASPFLCSKR